jgi:hypothetical protein
MPGFRSLALGSALLAGCLAFLLIAAPSVFVWMWQIEPGSGTDMVARRCGALFAGIAVILYRVRASGPGPERDAIAIGFAVGCVLLAVTGLQALYSGVAGLGILLAVAVELLLAAAFLSTRRNF